MIGFRISISIKNSILFYPKYWSFRRKVAIFTIIATSTTDIHNKKKNLSH